MTVRRNRQTESRKDTDRDAVNIAPDGWKPPSTLDAPPPREGMVQRWVATSIQGKDNTKNVMKRRQSGWSFRKKDTVGDFPVPTIDHGKYDGCIGVEGMVLMEMPKELAEKRNAYYRKKRDLQDRSVQAALGKFTQAHGEDIGMTDQTKVEKGRGQVKVMDD